MSDGPGLSAVSAADGGGERVRTHARAAGAAPELLPLELLLELPPELLLELLELPPELLLELLELLLALVAVPPPELLMPVETATLELVTEVVPVDAVVTMVDVPVELF